MKSKLLLLVLAVAIATLTATLSQLLAQQAPPTIPAGAARQKIVVRSVTGTMRYQTQGRFAEMTSNTQLTQGDTVVAAVGAVCKLEFQHPVSGAVLSAVILRGYTEMTVAEAYQQGALSRTQLDVPQGILRAGVVRTAVPPSFRVRTPRVVVAVRGSEIAELEVSNDKGDILQMGRLGVAMTHDLVPWFRSSRAGQGTRKRVEPDRRGGELVRAIDNAILTHRVLLHGPHRRGMEVAFDRQNAFDLVELNPGERYKSEGNPSRDRLVNAQRGHHPSLSLVICPACPKFQQKKN